MEDREKGLLEPNSRRVRPVSSRPWFPAYPFYSYSRVGIMTSIFSENHIQHAVYNTKADYINRAVTPSADPQLF